MAAMNAAFEAAMATAAQTARFYCVTVSPDARACARWPRLRGTAIAEGVQATFRIVEHVQLQLPTLRFHSMTTDFIKDADGVWWLTRVVDFQATSSVEPPRDDACFGSRDSAVFIPDTLRSRYGPTNDLLEDPTSPPKESTLLRGDELNNTMNTRSCFLCGCSCELPPTFRVQLDAMVRGQSGDELKTNSTTSIKAVDEFRMTLTMALDTIFLMRQRGVDLLVWENAVSTVRKSHLRDVCDFPTCTLCYRIYQQQQRLQSLARELHVVLFGMATSAASGLAPQLLSTELRRNQEAPRSVLESLEAFQTEKIPRSLLLRGDSPELRPSGSTLTPVRGADVDPTATQLRLVFFFHELQDGGPDLEPTDFYLEYQLGQNVTRVQLEGSKRHTPNRWQLCEARVHYLFATLEAFSEFCSQKRLLINSPSRQPSRYRDKEEFFGYTLLSLRSVNTAAKWFGNSLQPESRTDYLLELQTASFGLLTLKLTVGLLVDSVPLGHLRDVLRDRIFLEEQPPGGVYWPPTSLYLSGLAVPRDWVGALMPSEYTKLLPMRRRARGSDYSSRSLHVVTALMTWTTLSQACLAAKRLVFRITEDRATSGFPTVLLAAILRHASFVTPASHWKSAASLHFTRRYSVDRLLAEVRPATLPMLALLGELLFVLMEERELPATIDANVLASLIEPFWQHDSGWLPIPRTQSSCPPERRVIWNRAIRRWEVATGSITKDGAPVLAIQPHEDVIHHYGDTLRAEIGDFRIKILALVVCELFERMESLDDGYIEIAELRSLAKCLQGQEDLGLELDPHVGTLERLTQQDVAVLAELVDHQRRLALQTLLHSLMGMR
ncbi:uncharacterized protein PITG_09313 [Phytophthora infestans T30-4]|uniref:Uncharacterized protein n=1 Tax=Phytophthora infestans (strain T30-4) TaxID=403677 RepID=D0NBE3_PHYIT|nr:uncharacterized protein PITG_09313 [Phytophthora infestans T30-4]EEY55372.1 conserved hypothetical protein [Phytophthora infestans T30-4]|eukprot:XP_002903596.1 conserved hypothetical protein [Phytophthora infestans T30-4]